MEELNLLNKSSDMRLPDSPNAVNVSGVESTDGVVMPPSTERLEELSAELSMKDREFKKILEEKTRIIMEMRVILFFYMY